MESGLRELKIIKKLQKRKFEGTVSSLLMTCIIIPFYYRVSSVNIVYKKWILTGNIAAGTNNVILTEYIRTWDVTWKK